MIDYTHKDHYGLVGMKERAESIGGRFSIASRPNAGTVIDVSVPIEPKK